MKKHLSVQVSKDKSLRIPIKQNPDSSDFEVDEQINLYELIRNLDDDTIYQLKTGDHNLGKRNMSEFYRNSILSGLTPQNFGLEKQTSQSKSEDNNVQNFISFAQKKLKTSQYKESCPNLKSEGKINESMEKQQSTISQNDVISNSLLDTSISLAQNYKNVNTATLEASPLLFILDNSGNLLQWCLTKHVMIKNWKKIVGGSINHFLVSKDRKGIQIAFDQTASLREYNINR